MIYMIHNIIRSIAEENKVRHVWHLRNVSLALLPRRLILNKGTCVRCLFCFHFRQLCARLFFDLCFKQICVPLFGCGYHDNSYVVRRNNWCIETMCTCVS